ncbi:MAG: pirin family protein [bacterium]
MDAKNIDIRLKDTRFHTLSSWLDSRHSFSFGYHNDPKNTHHGLLLVNNDDIVMPGTGFTTHPHRDMEIVTCVLEGELAHTDSVGNKGIIYPGLAQRMSAGTGIWHSEMNPRSDKEVHFIQMWVFPDRDGIDPSYQQHDITPEIDRGGLIVIASGRENDAALRINQKGAILWVGRLKPQETVHVPDAPFVHLFVAKGSAKLEGGGLSQGDAVRLMASGNLKLTAGPAGVEVLIWEMDKEQKRL